MCWSFPVLPTHCHGAEMGPRERQTTHTTPHSPFRVLILDRTQRNKLLKRSKALPRWLPMTKSTLTSPHTAPVLRSDPRAKR